MPQRSRESWNKRPNERSRHIPSIRSPNKTETPSFPALDITFSAQTIADNNSGWSCVQMPGSAEVFGTGKAVKVERTVNGHKYAASMLPVGGGAHMMPIRAALRNTLGKGLGDVVNVHLSARTA